MRGWERLVMGLRTMNSFSVVGRWQYLSAQARMESLESGTDVVALGRRAASWSWS